MSEKLTIFISGTMRDLPKERPRVAAAIREMGHEPVWAEKRGATNRPSRDECERMARTCDVYLGLYGLGYGWKFPPEVTISVTEFEWQTAQRAGKPMLIYRQMGEPDPKQAAFLEKVGDWRQGRFWYEFETLDDLLPRLKGDLARLIAESFRPQRPALLADYRAHLRRLYADLPLAGIPVPLDVTLPLDRVYIKLRALPEQEEAARREAALPSDSDEELPRRLAERLWQQREEWEEAARQMEEARPIPPEEAIICHDRLAILGEAGAGKSTLLRHLAWERAGDPEAPLPLLIPLGLADVQVSTTGRSFLEAALDLLTGHKVGEERELLKQALADAIGEKNVLFLCDGLDEVHLARQSVVAGLESLAADGQRLVVTSRPLGYERLAGLEHFQVLPLLPEDAKAFSGRWFRALAAAQGVPEAEQEGWAQARADWLQRQLRERPGLREVAENPLLLTFLAVLAGDEPQRDLPQRRKELYRECVERLFTVWEARRRREGQLALGDLRGEKARRVALWGLYRTGWHLHRAYYGEEGLRAVRGEIEPLLARDMAERWKFDLLQAEALAAEVLHFWEGAGLLDVYRLAGQEWLAFRHLTFQEYGAARALAETYANDAEGLWQRLSPHLLHPQWGGSIPLTLAYLPEARATTLIERLLTANEGDEDRQRPLFLAAAALAEGAKVADYPHRQVVSALLQLARTRGFWEGGQRECAGNAVSALGWLMEDGYAAASLLALARDPAVDASVRAWAVATLGKLWRAKEAPGLFLALAQDRTEEGEVRMRAAEVLGDLGRADTAAELLLALAQDPTRGYEDQGMAAAALGRLGRVEEAAEFLLALAWDPAVGYKLRALTTKALAGLGRAEEAAQLLLALAWDPTVEAKVPAWAVVVVGELGQAEEAAMLLLALGQDPAVEARVQAWAAAALGELERATPEVLALAQDRAVEGWVRVRVAEALGELGRAEATGILLALAQDRVVGDWVRVWAAAALGKLGRVEEAAQFLLALAWDPTVGYRVQALAAAALRRLGRADDLLTLARDRTVEARVGVWAVVALERLGLGQAPPEVLAGLQALAVEPGISDDVRRAAREALTRLEG